MIQSHISNEQLGCLGSGDAEPASSRTSSHRAIVPDDIWQNALTAFRAWQNALTAFRAWQSALTAFRCQRADN